MIGQCKSNCPMVGQCMSNCRMIGQCILNCPMAGQCVSNGSMSNSWAVYVQLSNDFTMYIQLSDDWTVDVQLSVGWTVHIKLSDGWTVYVQLFNGCPNDLLHCVNYLTKQCVFKLMSQNITKCYTLSELNTRLSSDNFCPTKSCYWTVSNFSDPWEEDMKLFNKKNTYLKKIPQKP